MPHVVVDTNVFISLLTDRNEEQRARASMSEAARMLGYTAAELRAAIEGGEIEAVRTGSGVRIELREMAAQALHLWSLIAIEAALGRDAARIMPAALRTRKLTVRVPLYQLGMLEVLAGDGRESVDALLIRMFEELADLHKERLSPLIPGLADELRWPERDETQQPC